MGGLLPTAPLSVLIAAAVVVTSFFIGFGLQRAVVQNRRTKLAAWVLALGVPWLLERIFAQEPAGFRMLAIIASLFIGMKAVVGVSGEPRTGLPFRRWLLFSAAWPGMSPAVFNRPLRTLPGSGEMAFYGLTRLAAGFLMFLTASVIWRVPDSTGTTGLKWAASVLVLISISLAMHFGVINLLAAGLRRIGFDCRPLFRAPFHARSLGDFWSRRWNLAFSEMISISVYRPARRWGAGSATMAGFAVSGLFHEMAISWPVARGYGLPMLYFLLQGVFVIWENKAELSPVVRRCIAVAVVVLPLPMLFHPWFITWVVAPLLDAAAW